MPEQPITLTTADGQPLAATLFTPDQPNGCAVVINSALAVPRGYYARFAAFLSRRGFAVLTYDYRGVGESRRGSLRQMAASLLDWAVRDQTAALDWIWNHVPDAKRLVIGHSIGGQILGLTPHAAQIDGVLMVASQSGYWRGWHTLCWRLIMGTLWYATIPLLTRLMGYFPGSWIGIGEDIPGGVALDWARGGRSPRYFLDLYGGGANDHYGDLRAQLRSLAVADDNYAPPETVRTLLSFYPNAQTEFRLLCPQDLGVPRIGHFGFFRSSFESSLWGEQADWLARVQRLRP